MWRLLRSGRSQKRVKGTENKDTICNAHMESPPRDCHVPPLRIKYIYMCARAGASHVTSGNEVVAAGLPSSCRRVCRAAENFSAGRGALRALCGNDCSAAINQRWEARGRRVGEAREKREKRVRHPRGVLALPHTMGAAQSRFLNGQRCGSRGSRRWWCAGAACVSTHGSIEVYAGVYVRVCIV